ncbi:uncharacterized protein LOC117645791 [Thrips palmi]|uniref:Uncharacterized protein LOC117645791 n=1 Tax=Thrips palmi TaxID=161013 RepID=A0A6P8YXW8_THRPL|nr:uncharacterized protein LOC117645791 [Thrips palmi]
MPFHSWMDHVTHQGITHLSAAERKATCHLCLEICPGGGLEAHLEAHHRGDVECSLCAAHFLGVGGLARHKEDFHRLTPDGRAPPHVHAPVRAAVVGRCTVMGCSSVFVSWKEFVLHFEAQHMKNCSAHSRLCHLCLSCLPNDEAARLHQAKHARSVAHCCKKCSARFWNGKRLNAHISHFHRMV